MDANYLYLIRLTKATVLMDEDLGNIQDREALAQAIERRAKEDFIDSRSYSSQLLASCVNVLGDEDKALELFDNIEISLASASNFFKADEAVTFLARDILQRQRDGQALQFQD